ncbi:hypothetical protein THAOC_35110 [Thalassiosira oceanica]|uniref:Uncharacterized protein n=1 Tax=Thalassiosira oceanica TaxID=159749 RepID=K0R1E9_THAOC|nr:hypothetical protein THAOC_35110 [Thalassiosira oceanica]|eukprot:EJK46233.1 hypothetical protein THAOC_35110 [Thalassiosira oceanica]
MVEKKKGLYRFFEKRGLRTTNATAPPAAAAAAASAARRRRWEVRRVSCDCIVREGSPRIAAARASAAAPDAVPSAAAAGKQSDDDLMEIDERWR